MSKQTKAVDKDAEAMLIGLAANIEQRGCPAKPIRKPKIKKIDL